VYHVMSRTALDGFVLGEGEKDELLRIIKRLSAVYFTEVLGFSIMGNHFHLVVKVRPEDEYTDVEVRKRFKLYYGKGSKRELAEDQISDIRSKWGNISEYIKEIRRLNRVFPDITTVRLAGRVFSGQIDSKVF